MIEVHFAGNTLTKDFFLNVLFTRAALAHSPHGNLSDVRPALSPLPMLGPTHPVTSVFYFIRGRYAAGPWLLCPVCRV